MNNMFLLKLKFMKIVLWYIRSQQVSPKLSRSADELQSEINLLIKDDL